MHPKRILIAGITVALLAAPSWALAADHPTGTDNPGVTHQPATTPPVTTPSPTDHPTGDDHPTGTDNPRTTQKPSTPGPSASLPAKAKAYGTYCQGESKRHVAGQKGTPFSQCVTAMAKVATGKADTPRAACKDVSRKHVKGQKRTPYSVCVSGAAKLLKERQASDHA